MPRPVVEIEDVEAIGETEQALKCRMDDKEFWVPKSTIDDDSEVWEDGQSGTLVIWESIAIEKGLV